MGELHTTALVRNHRRWLWITLGVIASGLTLGVIEGVDRVREAAERSH